MKRQITPFEGHAHDIQYRKRDKQEATLISEDVDSLAGAIITFVVILIVSAIVAVGIIGLSMWTH